MNQYDKDKFRSICFSLANLSRPMAYSDKSCKTKIGYVLGVELNHIYCYEIMVYIEDINDVEKLNWHLLRDIYI